MRIDLPQGYVSSDCGSFHVVATRMRLQEMVDLLTGERRHEPAGDQTWGRGSTTKVTLSGGTNVFVRQYLRGGFARHFNRDLFLLRPPRPIHELVVTEVARSAGCPVPTVAAVCVEDTGPFYRGWIATEALENTRAFIEVYCEAASDDRKRLLEDAGAAIRSIHDACVYHVDLTGDNLLVDEGGSVSIIDFDKAVLRGQPSPRLARRGLDRFWRSMNKLGEASGAPVSDADRRWLENGYQR